MESRLRLSKRRRAAVLDSARFSTIVPIIALRRERRGRAMTCTAPTAACCIERFRCGSRPRPRRRTSRHAQICLPCESLTAVRQDFEEHHSDREHARVGGQSLHCEVVGRPPWRRVDTHLHPCPGAIDAADLLGPRTHPVALQPRRGSGGDGALAGGEKHRQRCRRRRGPAETWRSGDYSLHFTCVKAPSFGSS